MSHTVRRITCDLTAGTHRGLCFDARGRLCLRAGASGYEPEGEFISSVYDSGVGRRVSVQWTEQWTAPQRWKKYPANPVYGPHLSGAWDSWTNGVSIVLSQDGRTYKMFYAGREGAGIGFAEATIGDPVTWKEAPVSPVLRPRSDNWEGNLINQPRVVMVSPTHWRMYYTGWGATGPGSSWTMGLAESFDGGETWQRHGANPILKRGHAQTPDGAGACVPMVLRVDERWMMWYTAAVVNPKEHTHIHLCLALSDNGLHWRKYGGNPVLGDDFSDDPPRSVTSRCYVRRDHGVFQMWYSYAKPNYEIRYAESLDGIHWERSAVAPVLGPAPTPAWDDKMVEYPEVQVVNDVYRMWFCGNGFGSVGYAEGMVETGVEMAVRSGTTQIPDESWTGWNEVAREYVLNVSRFFQVRARLWSKNPLLSPSLNDIHADTGA